MFGVVFFSRIGSDSCALGSSQADRREQQTRRNFTQCASVDTGSLTGHPDAGIVDSPSCDADKAKIPSLKPPTPDPHFLRRDSMTDISYSVTPHAGHDYSPAPLVQAPSAQHLRNGAFLEEGAQEDDGQISCICGFFDDDGWTVQCDKCNKWQHQACYYPHYEDRSLPEELQHYCVECNPRPIDSQGARIRQRARRDEAESMLNGAKRPAPKNHKKKVKEPGYTNGWPLDKTRHDRNSASPRDQQPPSKRPKTSHRPSDSLTNASTKGHSRKRTVSNVNHRRSVSRSPDSPIPVYSHEFLRCYSDNDWAIAETNLHNSIAVSDALSLWLNAPDDTFKEMHNGLEKSQVLMRWDGELDDIPNKAQLEIVENSHDEMRQIDGQVPCWKHLTVQEPLATGAYIGELKGHVGFKDDYYEDETNRWSDLRHPEPFVFFHPKLPIYIDARNEGTELRYVRRSCKPNANLQILVTDQTHYRFCFMALQQIDPGDEIAVSWETTHSVPELFRRGVESASELATKDLQRLSSWVSTTLSNCGPCACHRGPDECLMQRFDRRVDLRDDYANGAQTGKIPKARKRKPGQHISPINTHVTSRSGSEALKADPDDDRSDSSRSARGSASRDNTPNTHYSHSGSRGATAEMSERERKKLEREEAIFRRQEEEKSGKQGKKKRNSGGSSLSTPSASASKQVGGSSNYVNASTSKQSGLPSAKVGRRLKASSDQNSPPKMIVKTVKRPKPDYVDSSVQCDMDQEEAERRIKECRPRKFVSNTQRLLQRCALNNARRKGPAALAEAAKAMSIDDKMDVDKREESLPDSKPNEFQKPEPEPTPTPNTTADTEMKDASSDHQSTGDAQTKDTSTSPISPPSSSMGPPPPPWPSQIAHTAPDSSQPHKPLDMHIQMPPPTANPFSTSSSAALSTGGSTTAATEATFTQSPSTMTTNTPIFSPSVTSAVTPRKKISFSEYMKSKKAAKVSESASGDREGSPASTASGPIASGTATAAEVAKAAEGSAIVEDGDVKMEDASASGQSPEASRS